MLKYLITQDAYLALPDSLKNEYTSVGDKYSLQTDTPPKVTELSNELLSIKGDLKNEKSLHSTLMMNHEKLNQDLDLANSTKNATDKKTEKLWQTRISDAKTQTDDAYSSLYTALTDVILNDKANSISSELSINGSDILAPHIRNRLDVEMDENHKISMTVKDADGNKSLLSANELMDEFRSNPSFEPFIKGSAASGGQSGENSKSSSKVNNDASGVDLLTMTREQKLAYYKEKRESLS